MEIYENERFDHLKAYIENSFTSVVLDQTARQMNKMDVSSQFVSERFTETFANLLIQERKAFAFQLLSELKEVKTEKNELEEEIQKKNQQNENYIEEAINENRDIRSKVMQLRLNRDLTISRDRSNESRAQHKFDHLNHQINTMLSPLSDLKKQVKSQHEEISGINESISLYVKAKEQEIMMMRDQYQRKYIEFRKTKMDSPTLRKYETQLENEKEKTNNMRNSIETLLTYISNIIQQNENQNERNDNDKGKENSESLLHINNYSKKRLYTLLKMRLKEEYNLSIIKTYQSLKCKDYKISSALDVISYNIDKGIDNVKKEYGKVFTAQQKRVELLHEQLKKARKQISALEKPRSPTPKIIQEIDKVKQKMIMECSETDMKMGLLEHSSFLN